MRIGLISDPHGNSIALNAVLVALDQQDVDLIVCTGDIIGYYPYVNETIDLLRERDVICILGNHDCYLLGRLPVSKEHWRIYNLDYVDRVIRKDNRLWLTRLPSEQYLKFNGLRCYFCHGSPWSIEEYIYPDYKDFERFATMDVDIVVMGHTHIPLVLMVRNVLLVNSGSCGQPRDYNPLAAYALLNTETRTAEIYRIAYDVDKVCKRVMAEGFDQKLIDVLRRTK